MEYLCVKHSTIYSDQGFPSKFMFTRLPKVITFITVQVCGKTNQAENFSEYFSTTYPQFRKSLISKIPLEKLCTD